MLATLECEHHDELEADFQQYYGLDIGGMGEGYTVSHAACLAAQLPHGSRCMSLLSGSNGWTDETVLLSLIEYDIRNLASSFSDDPPELHPPFQYADLHQVGGDDGDEYRSMVDSVLGMSDEDITTE